MQASGTPPTEQVQRKRSNNLLDAYEQKREARRAAVSGGKHEAAASRPARAPGATRRRVLGQHLHVATARAGTAGDGRNAQGVHPENAGPRSREAQGRGTEPGADGKRASCRSSWLPRCGLGFPRTSIRSTPSIYQAGHRGEGRVSIAKQVLEPLHKQNQQHEAQVPGTRTFKEQHPDLTATTRQASKNGVYKALQKPTRRSSSNQAYWMVKGKTLAAQQRDQQERHSAEVALHRRAAHSEQPRSPVGAVRPGKQVLTAEIRDRKDASAYDIYQRLP